jgi:hypothetical protein
MPEVRDVTNEDLANVDRAIGGNETFLRDLYVLRKVLSEIGKLDFPAIKSNQQAQQGRLDDLRKLADAAQAGLDEVQRQIVDKKRELAAVETTITERTIVANQLNEAVLGLRNMLAAA